MRVSGQLHFAQDLLQKYSNALKKLAPSLCCCSIARVISPAKESPGCTSRGAIQQRIPMFSSAAQTASATGLSSEECEMKTSCAIQF